MTMERTPEYLTSLVRELCRLPRETEWVEFKSNNADPREIGEYLSALSNSAALADRAVAYLVWGVSDDAHEVVGTTFSPAEAKVGREELENWLLRLLDPRISFAFWRFDLDGLPVVLLEVGRAHGRPVRFEGQEYIRVGSYKKKLRDFPEKERELWRVFDQTPFEELVAAEHLTTEDVLKLLDYPAYFDLLQLPLPETRDGVFAALTADLLIQAGVAGDWAITSLGAVLFAKRLTDFRTLARKTMRVVVYRGNSRIETIREQSAVKGYASGFEGLIELINGLLPTQEVIGQSLRSLQPVYPELAVRELVANALIHQDFAATGAGPMVEIFGDRIEITNPGTPLVATDRFLDSPPRSRNERLASLMRRARICEERGSGVDKVVSQTELHQLPAPAFEVAGENTRALLFGPRPLARMDQQDRIRACYLHACLRYVSRDVMTNSSLRERFGIEAKNSATASRLIKEAVAAGAIKPYDEAAARKFMRYLPFWA